MEIPDKHIQQLELLEKSPCQFARPDTSRLVSPIKSITGENHAGQ
jgi:hypothetical protein